MGAESVLTFKLLGLDVSASRTVEKFGATAEAASLKLASGAEKAAAAQAKVVKAFGAVGKASAAIAVGIGIAGVKAATTFEQSMTRITTQAGVPKAAVDDLGKQVLALAPKVGQGPDKLADALYHIESSFASTGITATKAMSLLKIASEGANIGGSDLVDTTNALDAAVVSGIKGVQDYSQAMGALTKIVGSGDMSMQDLADAFGTGAIANVKNYGLSLTDAGAALATFGDNNIRGADAGTQLRMVVQGLTKATPEGVKQLAAMGITAHQLGDDMAHGGLNQAMQDLVTHMDKAGITGNKVGQFITDSFGKKAGAGLGILVGQFDRFESKFSEIQASSGNFSKAVTEQQATEAQKMKDVRAEWDAFLIQIGQAIIPKLKTVADFLAKHPALIKDTAEAVGIFGAAWAAVKLGSIAANIATVSARLLGLGLASQAAAGAEGMAGLETAAAQVERELGTGLAPAAQRSIIGITGIGTAVARLGTVGGIAFVGYELMQWAQSAGKARQQIDAITSTKITNPLDTSQLTSAASGVQGLVDKADKQNNEGWLKSIGNAITGQTLTNNAIISQGEAKVAQLKGTAANVAVALDQLHNKFGLTISDLQTLAAKGNIKFGTDITGLVKGEAAFSKLYGTELAALPINQRAAKSLADEGDSADTASKKIDALSGVVNGLMTAQAAGITAADTYHKGLNDLGQSLDQNNKTLVGNSDAAINNREAIIGLATNMTAAAVAYAKSTGHAGDYSKALQLGVGQIEAFGIANHASKDQVDGLLKSLGLMPDHKAVQISTPGADAALAYIAAIRNAIDTMPSVKSIYFQASLDPTLGKLGNGLGVLTSQGLGAATLAHAAHKARGGMIYGAGTGTSDSVPAMLSRGEFVMNAKAAAANLPALTAMNSGRPAGGATVHVHLNVSTLDTKSFQQFVDSPIVARTLAGAVHKAVGGGASFRGAGPFNPKGTLLMAHRFNTMPNANKSTTERGYGTAHKRARRQWAARHDPSDPCTRCGRPLGPMGPWLHLDHNASRTGYLGFAHGMTCNVKAGARAGRARQNVNWLKW